MQRPGAGEEPGLVDAREQHLVRRAEDVVRPVAVVDVPVEDEDAADAEGVERVTSRDRDVVEEAEPRRGVAAGVVARRPRRAEADAVRRGRAAPRSWRRPRRLRCSRLVGPGSDDGLSVERAAARSLIERTVSTYSPACTATSASRDTGAAWRRS